MELNDLLRLEGIDPQRVLVLRHRPHERELRKVLPWLAAERPDVFNAYQQTQSPQLERAMDRMVGNGFVASFIGHEPGRALFIGLYSIAGSRPLTFGQYWSIPAYVEMREHGMWGWRKEEDRERVVWFDLVQTEFYKQWKGKCIIEWPPPERSWWRRSHRNSMPVRAILEDSALNPAMPEWDRIELTWTELQLIPMRWKAALAQWRGIYYIFDKSDRRGYVGSAYGDENLLGRWQNYATDGHGGNVELRTREPRNFTFTILQRVSPDMEASAVIDLETSWKTRLHTRKPIGLNSN